MRNKQKFVCSINSRICNVKATKCILLGISEEGILRVPGSAARIRVRRHSVLILVYVIAWFRVQFEAKTCTNNIHEKKLT